ncbi:hypothetical protein ACWDV4_25530 [Micromonospora sp. NPDC003197]
MSMQPFHPGRCHEPDWCRERDCAETALHQSPLREIAPRGDEVIQVRARLWQIGVDSTRINGVLLELSVGEDVECWPIDLAQSRALVGVLRDLLRIADRAAARAAGPERPVAVAAMSSGRANLPG